MNPATSASESLFSLKPSRGTSIFPQQNRVFVPIGRHRIFVFPSESVEPSREELETALENVITAQTTEIVYAQIGSPTLPELLHLKYQKALINAQEYRQQFGDPIDNLISLLDHVADEDTWRRLLDEPYR